MTAIRVLSHFCPNRSADLQMRVVSKLKTGGSTGFPAFPCHCCVAPRHPRAPHSGFTADIAAIQACTGPGRRGSFDADLGFC